MFSFLFNMPHLTELLKSEIIVLYEQDGSINQLQEDFI